MSCRDHSQDTFFSRNETLSVLELEFISLASRIDSNPTADWLSTTSKERRLLGTDASVGRGVWVTDPRRSTDPHLTRTPNC